MADINKENKKKSISRPLLLSVAITIVVLSILFNQNNIKTVSEIIKNSDKRYIGITIGLSLFYAIFSPIPFLLLTRKQTNVPQIASYMINMTEPFFNGITPFSTGGQPFEIYFFDKINVRAAKSTGLLLANFFINLLVTVIYLIISFIYLPLKTDFLANKNNVIMLSVGTISTLFTLTITLVFSMNRRFRHMAINLIKKVSKWKYIGKYIEPQQEKFHNYFKQTQVTFKLLLNNKLDFFFSLLTRFILMSINYAIPFFILKSLHVDLPFNELFKIICITFFGITMVIWLPTPGSSGGIEFIFKAIFTNIISTEILKGYNKTDIAASGMLLWRLLTFYLVLFIGFLCYIYFDLVMSRKEKYQAPIAEITTETPYDNIPDIELKTENETITPDATI